MASWPDLTVTSRHLLPYVDSKAASPDIAAALNTLPFERNIFKLLANGQSLFVPFMTLLSSCWGPNRAARPSDWQLIVLRTAALLDAPYEWSVNEPVARLLGFGDARLAAIRAGDLSSTKLFTDRQRLISRIVEESVEKNIVSEETIVKAREELGAEVTMEVMLIHGVYGTLARVMQSARIDYDPEIPDLVEMLSKYNAHAIERERKYAEEDGTEFGA